MNRFRLIALVAILAVLGQLLPASVGAQTDEIENLRDERDRIRAQEVEYARFLEPLEAQDQELEAAVETLQENVMTQQAQLASTRVAIDQALFEEVLAADEVEALKLEVAILKEVIRQQAIEAYVQPQASTFSQFVTADDLGEAGRRRAVLDTIGQRDADALEQLRGAEERLEDLLSEAAAVRLTIEDQQRQEAQQLVGIKDALAEQERLRLALADRVDGLVAEVDALAADEAEVIRIMNELIAEEERKAAEAERQRIAAERARIAALTAPPPQVAPIQRSSEDTAGAGALARPQPSEITAPEPDPPPLPAASQAPSGAGSLGMPVSGTITSFFGPRWGRMHQGIDVAANSGTTIVASGAGRVASAGPNGGFGNMVIVDHGSGVTTLYAHMSWIGVQPGDSVSRGQAIGQVGCTGSCTGPHVHFEVRVNGTAYDPMGYL